MDFNAYPYPTHSMTSNRYDDNTIQISLDFIKEFEKDKSYTTITHDDIQSGRVKSGTIIGYCTFCQNKNALSHSMLYYQDKECNNYMYCVCCDCVNEYDENN